MSSFTFSAPFSRPNWAQIDLTALRHNARQLAALAGGAQILAVIKAGAYGHGAFRVARTLENESAVSHFGVASVDEGLELRALGVQKPILLLSALLPEEVETVVSAELIPTISCGQMARSVADEAERQGRVARAHLKIDTGMSRLGVAPSEARELWETIQTLPFLRVEGIYTHFACADDEPDEMSARQLDCFNAVLRELNLPQNVLRHAANSAATLRYPAAHFDLVRPGLALYGAHPCSDLGEKIDLKPVMTWKARVTFLKNLAPNQSVSYGATWKAPNSSQIAVVPCGYADGLPRSLSNRGEVLIRGQRCPIVGRVTMDQILVDVTGKGIHIGDEVILWGEGLPVEEVAAQADTIAYELFCRVSARVPRVEVG